MFHTPVLFLIYNRPLKTELVFNVLRQLKPHYLYISADGPNSDRISDLEMCLKTREVVLDNIDWDCEIRTSFNDNNLGCGLAVSSAISWFFENVEYGIIIEDDCIPHLSFFKFCEVLLEKYNYNSQIMVISGTALPENILHTDNSYIFSKYCSIWGWATWKRAWKQYDYNMLNWPITRQSNMLNQVGNYKKRFSWYWKNNFDLVYNKLIDTWDYQWYYTIFKEHGLTIIPTENLIQNIGFDAEGTHTKEEHPLFSYYTATGVSFPLKHPAVVEIDFKADKYLINSWMGITQSRYLKVMFYDSKPIRLLVKIKKIIIKVLL